MAKKFKPIGFPKVEEPKKEKKVETIKIKKSGQRVFFRSGSYKRLRPDE